MKQALGFALLLSLVGVVGCAPSAPGRPGGAGAGGREATTPKTLGIAQLNSIKSYSFWGFADTGGGGFSMAGIHTVGLVAQDDAGNRQGRLAAAVPSFDDGTIVILPDGRMRTTWRLRPNVKWHDGQPFTAEDMVFSAAVARDPEFSALANTPIPFTDTVEAPDPLTLVITWKNTYYRALDLGHREFWPFPRHILAGPMLGDRDAFLAHPFFTTEYVNLGPFRLVDYGLGENQVFERFDDYFLGRPKVDTIIIRTIGDPNTIIANLRAGAVDIAVEKSLPLTAFVRLLEEWGQTKEGFLVQRQDNWRYIRLQMGAQFAQPVELAQDVRVRRGLYHAIDRDALREFVLPGFANTSADTFLQASDARGSIVGRPFARYAYDPARATQEFADASWRRTADGRLANPEGRVFQFELRGSNQTDAPEVSVIADYWRKVGAEVAEVIPPPALARGNREYSATFPGGVVTARSSGDEIFPVFDSRLHPDPDRAWVGGNEGRYANPRMDALIDRLYATIAEQDQAVLLREMGDLLGTDLPVLPIYFRTTFAAVRGGVQALEDFAGTRGTASGPGLASRKAHLWDRD